MDSRKIANFFSIEYPYNKDSLDIGYSHKIKNLELNNSIDLQDKQILLNDYYNKYKLGLTYLDNIFNLFNNFGDFQNLLTNDSINSKSYSYISNTINGNKTVLESETVKIKDKTDTKKNAYTIDNKGNKVELDYDKEITKYKQPLLKYDKKYKLKKIQK